MNVEQAINLVQGILSAQKLTIQEHQQVQEAFSMILKNLKPAAARRKADRVDPILRDRGSDDVDDAVQLQGPDGQG